MHWRSPRDLANKLQYWHAQASRLPAPEPEGPSRATILSGSKVTSRWSTAMWRPLAEGNSFTRSDVCRPKPSSAQAAGQSSSSSNQDTHSDAHAAGAGAQCTIAHPVAGHLEATALGVWGPCQPSGCEQQQVLEPHLPGCWSLLGSRAI